MTYDAIVIGAGPAGSTAALMLARAGWSVAVVEKSGYPRLKVCGEFISPSTLPLLDELGLLDEFLNQAGPEIRRVCLFANETVVSASLPRPSHPWAKFGHALGRDHLDLLMLEAARRAGATVFQPWKASEVRAVGRRHVCVVSAARTSRELSARIIIAAHGSWEAGVVNPPGEHHSSDLLAFKAHFLGCNLPPDTMPLLTFPGGYGGMVQSDKNRVSLSCCIRRDMLRRCRETRPSLRAGEAVLQHIKAHCRGVEASLRHAHLDGTWHSAGPIRPGILNCYSDRVFRVGNCAGEAHPVIAEGISMAIQSAALLASHLISANGCRSSEKVIDEIGKAYAADWKRHFGLRIRASSLFAHLAMSPAAANLIRPLIEHSPKLLTLGAQVVGKASPMTLAASRVVN